MFITLASRSSSQATPTSAPPLLLGTAWYPEQWPESRWDADLTLMQQSGIHMVRIAEFAWSRMEPAEGKYDFDWLDHAIKAADKHNTYTVIGTPTAAPPAWLTKKYPETLHERRWTPRSGRQLVEFALRHRVDDVGKTMAGSGGSGHRNPPGEFGARESALDFVLDSHYEFSPQGGSTAGKHAQAPR